MHGLVHLPTVEGPLDGSLVYGVLMGVKIPGNKSGHYPFYKSQLDSRTFGMASSTGLWTRYHLGGDLNRLSSTKKKSTS